MKVIESYINWRSAALPKAVDGIKKLYMDIMHPNRIPWNETTESLANYPSESLGMVLHQFLTNGNIQLEAKYESHDVYHVMTGYGLGLNNEARLFFFLFGNGKHTVSILGSMLVAIVFIPDLWGQFYKDYQRGKTFRSIKDIDFEHRLHENYEALKRELLV